MSGYATIRQGMPVYGSDDELIGTVEGRQADGIQVNGQHIPEDLIERVDQQHVYLQRPASAVIADTGMFRGALTSEQTTPVALRRTETRARPPLSEDQLREAWNRPRDQ